MSRLRVSATLAVCLLGTSATAVAAPPPSDPGCADGPSFEGLGDLPGGDRASFATGVSDHGDVVVGWSRDAAGDAAFLWTPAEGLTSLGGEASRAQTVSPNGTWIAGSVEDIDPETLFTKDRGAVRFWIGQEPELLVGETFPGTEVPFFWFVDATVAIDGGPIYGTCLQSGAYGVPLSCRYDGPGELQPLPGGGYTHDADAQGNYAGTRISDPRSGEPPVAMFNGQPLGYPASGIACDPPRYCSSDAQAFSADLSVIVGTSMVPLPDADEAEAPLWDAAFVHTVEQGMARLRDLPGGTQESGAYAVDDSGRIIAGFGTDSRGQAAVVWLDRRPIPLAWLLRRFRVFVPRGWNLREIRAMTPDGRIMVGNGENPEGDSEAFRVVLPEWF